MKGSNLYNWKTRLRLKLGLNRYNNPFELGGWTTMNPTDRNNINATSIPIQVSLVLDLPFQYFIA